MSRIFHYLKKNKVDLAILWLRVLTGLGIMTHGYRKIFLGNMVRFIESIGNMGFPFPAFFGWVAALSEFVGGWMLVFGLGTRIAAVFLVGTMFVAAFIRHGDDPFSGKEKALTYLTLAGAAGILGGGKYSLDFLIKQKIAGSRQVSFQPESEG
ncbi:MAG: putative oxidoreductase CatD [Candidatus Marinimicrobia bacterium]|nr:putative oxidoreductase CatD [Candidatus Neomarinimicrobiota bacterium]